MTKGEEPAIKDYIVLHTKYAPLYENAVVLFQIGKFYEIYNIDGVGPNLEAISNVVDAVVTKKKDLVEYPEYKNIRLVGFPLCMCVDRIGKLVSNGYTVIIADQCSTTPKGKRKERKVSQILTSGTIIDGSETRISNSVVCLYLSNNIQKNKKYLTSCGMSSCDILTGKCYVQESYSTFEDTNFAIDEAKRFIEVITPTEIVIHIQKELTSEEKEQLVNQLGVDENICKFINKINPMFFKVAYQNELLKRVYPKTGELTPIEYFEMHETPCQVTSLALLIQYIYEHNQHIVDNLQEPTNFQNNKYVVIGTNGLRQLNVLPNNNERKRGINSLFDVVNYTSTVIGKRYLKERLTMPIVDPDELERLYDIVDALSESNQIEGIEKYLCQIGDIERLSKKISIGSIYPSELHKMIQSSEQIVNLLKHVNKQTYQNLVIDKKTLISYQKKLEKFLSECQRLFIYEKLDQQHIAYNIFKPTIDKEIDELVNKIDGGISVMEKLRDYLTKKLTGYENPIVLKHNATDGYYLSLTQKRADELLRKLKTDKNIKIEKLVIPISELKFVQNKSYSKLTFAGMKSHSKNVDQDKEHLIHKIEKRYSIVLSEFHATFGDLFRDLCVFIGFIDFMKSNAKCAITNKYVRPTITTTHKNSYVNCQDLRHPIIEKLIKHTYVPHTIELGTKNTKGVLLYGLNSSGKSALMKAVGLGIIMAQCGMFVPATEFTYMPYRAIYTRINGDDNIFKGLSSFGTELMELKAILNRASFDTLVIGDEVCRGTEHVSANSIVAGTILKLHKLTSTFLFATHLHELAELDEIKNMKDIKIFHLSVDYDEKTGTIVYDRLLKEGSGEKIYGTIVAKNIIHDVEFNDIVNNIKNKLLKTTGYIVTPKQSKYNPNVIVDKCQICGKKSDCTMSVLDTHHIKEQHTFTKSESKQKNNTNNLVILCKDCHNKIHEGKLQIKGITMTNVGYVIDYI